MQDEATAQPATAHWSRRQATRARATPTAARRRRRRRGHAEAAAAQRRASTRGARAPFAPGTGRPRARARRPPPHPAAERRLHGVGFEGHDAPGRDEWRIPRAGRPRAPSGSARGTRSVTPAAAPARAGARRTAQPGHAAARRLNARCTTTTLGSAPTSCRRGGAARSTAWSGKVYYVNAQERPVLLGAAARRRAVCRSRWPRPKGGGSTSGAPTACARGQGRAFEAACGGRPGAATLTAEECEGLPLRGGAGPLAPETIKPRVPSRCPASGRACSAASTRARTPPPARRAPSGCRARSGGACAPASKWADARIKMPLKQPNGARGGRAPRARGSAAAAAAGPASRPRRPGRGGAGGGGDELGWRGAVGRGALSTIGTTS